jgi:hypothetical protein
MAFEDEHGNTYSDKTLIAAWHGELGEDGEHWARAVVPLLEAEGYFDEDGEADPFDDEEEVYADERPEVGDDEWRQHFLNETGRLAKDLDRPVTQKEFREIAEDVGPQGVIPDLVAVYGPDLKAKMKDPDERLRVMADLVQDADELRAHENGDLLEGPLEPREMGEVDLKNDEDRRDFMAEDYAARQAEDGSDTVLRPADDADEVEAA